MKSGFKFLLGAGAVMAAALPFAIKNEEKQGEVEVRSLLYHVKYTKPEEGEEKGRVSVSLPGVNSAETLGEFIGSVKNGAEVLLSKLGSSDLTVEDIRDKAVSAFENLSDMVSEAVSGLSDDDDEDIEVEIVVEDEPVMDAPLSDDAEDFADGE